MAAITSHFLACIVEYDIRNMNEMSHKDPPASRLTVPASKTIVSTHEPLLNSAIFCDLGVHFERRIGRIKLCNDLKAAGVIRNILVNNLESRPSISASTASLCRTVFLFLMHANFLRMRIKVRGRNHESR
jgi:hypothetical protein